MTGAEAHGILEAEGSAHAGTLYSVFCWEGSGCRGELALGDAAGAET